MCQSQREYSCQYEMLKNIFLDYIYFQALTSILTNFPVIHLFSSLVFLYSMKNMCVHMINSFPSPWPLNLLFSCLDPFMILPLSISPLWRDHTIYSAPPVSLSLGKFVCIYDLALIHEIVSFSP